MRRTIISIVALFLSLSTVSVYAQKKFDGKVLKEVNEWRIDGKKKSLDHKTTYKDGKKVEEIEYSSTGDQKERVTYKYNEAGKCIEESVYDEYNKLEKTIKYEYLENGKKKSQTTFLPNGKQKNHKEFEYITE